MGASQSSGTGASSAAVDVKTSYYELLAVDRHATEDEIKKAYRRKALELHPDRNFGNEEAATKTFAEIQAAYEVLSDPQERAWYDSHESAILRGDDPGEGDVPSYNNIKITSADDLARLVRKFNSNVEFSDSPSGFFGFVRDTFDQLAKEEEAAATWENVEVHEYPTFGHKDDEYQDVVKNFYASWSSFATVKSFSWTDKYRLSEAPDRWYRRRMEQENNRIRQDAKREFNDAVRSLVAFIRKRDPRYVPNTQSEQERQQTLREAAAAQAARARAANAAKLDNDIPEWAKMREPEELEESEEEEIVQEVFECVACDKVFKSERQWEAHEKSKKHQKAVRSLQQKMRKEDVNFDLADDAMDEGGEFVKIEAEDEEGVDEMGHEDAPGSDQEAEDPSTQQHESNEIETHDQDSDDDMTPHRKPQQTKTTSQGTPDEHASPASDSDDDDVDDDYASIEAIQARMASVALETNDSESEAPPSAPKMGKAAQKRAKKAAAAAASQQTEKTNTCGVCNESFPSRTTLFKHIKDEGHAALKTVNGGGGGGKGKKGKGKR